MNSKLYIETYGCQMNFSDSEIVGAILEHNKCTLIKDVEQADIILINTCSIRENAENRIFHRLENLRHLKKKNPLLIIGVIGCMAERMKDDLIAKEPIVNIIAGPDSYRDLPKMIEMVKVSGQAVETLLSEEETYGEIMPVRIDSNGVSAFISIMRGCENYCSYCVVPYTRGKERSRDPETIVNEATYLFNHGYKEITLLGQNVNSYHWECADGKMINFSSLIALVAKVSPTLRVRFSTSHPKDFSDELIDTIASYDNICNFIHLPMQSGSTAVLKKMNRKYTREWYLDRINAIKTRIPDCGLSTDIIAGFCGETEEDHQQTLSMMKEVGYDSAFMFKYSERPGTLAQRHFPNDVPEDVKSRRLEEIIDLQQQSSLENNKKDVGKVFEVLVEGETKRSDKQLFGCNSQNKVIIFDRAEIKAGDYVNVKVVDCTAATLMGEIVS
ncbi:MAG: tRNA (N6-isopentenyl adenosine(37)-C2)-methylthiotransferase MiaB [Bacteroidales bacterium]|nr:tRNA (N6-isopentenyl adenosine(37)-C2)-methylthiotransferase MiaB [Bacteroidales bacterium]MDD3152733.1 tRNA (N6-isopentenyl adenosine(37)-C2)-methylthiotransferase MiaB [Bacteroidales bacterium]MDD4633048.1 tRNA (N6-isopentenyl adenosine(37)-C2)-methylthiotransferase MiaB [Bacteroidales bacterium]